jgi:ElaB/YqjD/DUF883 family membrane-anchored ribosome-binding protein
MPLDPAAGSCEEGVATTVEVDARRGPPRLSVLDRGRTPAAQGARPSASSFNEGEHMTEIAQQQSRGAPGDGQSTTDQAKEKVQEGAEQVQQKAQELKSQAGGRIRQELDARSTDAGSQLLSTAEAMRRSSRQLQEEGKEVPARVTTAVADRAERLGDYMTVANADRIVRDVESFARRQPWLVAIGGAVVGFLGSRFLKASSGNRYESGNGSESNGREDWRPVTSGSADVGNEAPAPLAASASEWGGAGGNSEQ